MLKSKTVLHVEIEGRVYELLCEPDAPLGGVHDSLCQMKAYVVKRIVDQQESESKVQEESCQKQS